MPLGPKSGELSENEAQAPTHAVDGPEAPPPARPPATIAAMKVEAGALVPLAGGYGSDLGAAFAAGAQVGRELVFEPRAIVRGSTGSSKSGTFTEAGVELGVGYRYRPTGFTPLVGASAGLHYLFSKQWFTSDVGSVIVTHTESFKRFSGIAPALGSRVGVEQLWPSGYGFTVSADYTLCLLQTRDTSANQALLATVGFIFSGPR